MADIRATQAAVLTLDDSPADARISQAAVLALTPVLVPSDARITQAAVLVMGRDTVGCRITQAPTLALVRELPCLTRHCQCWKITRTDGETFRFTTHDEPVAFKGEVYQPCDSLSATAASSGSANEGVGDVSVEGVVSDDSITPEDLAYGLFDGARVEVWLTQWGEVDPGYAPTRLAQGVLGATTQGRIRYTAELRTPAALLMQQPILQQYTPACRFKFGDSRCTKDLLPLKVTGTVTEMGPRLAFRRETYRIFTDAARVEADGFFNGGSLTWLTGANAGLSVEVNASTAAGEITQWLPVPHEIQVGDTYEMTPGCNKSEAACKAYANYANFGGFPHIPGMDAMAQTPNAH